MNIQKFLLITLFAVLGSLIATTFWACGTGEETHAGVVITGNAVSGSLELDTQEVALHKATRSQVLKKQAMVYLQQKTGNILEVVDSILSDSSFEFTELEDGTYSISVNLDDEYGATVPEFTLSDNETKDLGTITLNIFITINMQVTNNITNIYYNGQAVNTGENGDLSLDIPDQSNPQEFQVMQINENDTTWVSYTLELVDGTWTLVPPENEENELIVLETSSSSEIVISSSNSSSSSIEDISSSSSSSSVEIISSSSSEEIVSSSSSVEIYSFLDTIPGDSFLNLSLSEYPTIHTQSLTSGDSFSITAFGDAHYSNGSTVSEIACLTSPNVQGRARYDIIPLNDTLKFVSRYEWGDCFVADKGNLSSGAIYVQIFKQGNPQVEVLTDSLVFPQDMIVLTDQNTTMITNIPSDSISIEITGQAYFDMYNEDPINGVFFLHNTQTEQKLSVIETGAFSNWNNQSDTLYAFLVDHVRYKQNLGEFHIHITTP